MGQLLAVLLRSLGRNLLVFAAIVLVLASASWVRDEWRDIQHIVGELPALRQAQAVFDERRAALVHATEEEVRRLSGAGIAQLDRRIAAIDGEIAQLRREQEAAPVLGAVLAGREALAQQLARSAMRDMEIELRRQEKTHLLALRARADALANRQAALATLERLRREHVAVYTALQDTLKRRAQLEAAAGTWGKLFFTEDYRHLRALDARAAQLRARNTAAHRAFQAQRALVNTLPSVGAPAAFRLNDEALAAAAAPLRERLREVEQLAGTSGAWQVYGVVQPLLLPALLVLLGWWLAPAAIRALFYFVLAPLAARRLAIVIGAAAAQTRPRMSSRISAVSQALALAPGDELLVRPDYCQSQPAGVAVATRVLFDWRRPLSSLAARLWMLKRLRAVTAAEVVVSATLDPLDEVALLELAPGESFVLQPSCLVGMVLGGGRRPVIRSHWRLGTLHAWLTLQLRYLSFEGPATLVLKGCRGVRLEHAGRGRTISQDATLGFSAHAGYGTVRAEPFLPYLAGRQPLFHDSFTGQDACFLYEEVPRAAQEGRRRNNPFGMLLDAGLKAFGI
ncbi:hypothetical protein [Massilia sp. BSC265]|uniref:hypothetical protein n=1 Tax=Massilia sp. BSC265 TaxID=1549812 RepID=UPI0004E93BDC|nr:hypothetical protein [Massilia sp. BSC265]KFI06586.1 hypothetical protein JN27_12885 [Massilia sp. BSC265]